MESAKNITDFIIVGAGFAGLSAGYQLFKNGHKIVVLEANERVGGRAFECNIGTFRLELGGEYLSSEQTRLTALINELGLDTYPAYGTGNHFLSMGGKTSFYTESPTSVLSEKDQEEIEIVLDLLMSMLPDISATHPWNHPKAKERDGVTFQTWLEKHLRSKVSKDFFRFLTNQGFSTDPEKISLLQMLWFLKTSHGIPAWAVGGSQANRVLGGPELVATEIAMKLGHSMRFGEQVLEILQDSNEVHVQTQKNYYRAKGVLICIPPHLISGLRFKPQLPENLFRTFQAFQTGNAIKVQAVYKKPFWREKGLSGNGISFEGPQTFTYDNSSPDGHPGVLLGFITGSRATFWNQKSVEERKEAVLSTWGSVFGNEALHPIDYIEMDWMKEPFARGGHGCHFPPGVWTELGPCLGGDEMPQFGRVVFASSDIAKDWNGYFEGAVQAGYLAANQIEELHAAVSHKSSH